MKPRYLMCPPTYYGVHYDINPWMSQHVGLSTEGAARQWERLVEIIETVADVDVQFMEPTSGVPDLVFTANGALICGGLAICSSFRFEQRRREQPLYRSWFARNGFATTYLTSTFFEGAGDALFDRRRPILYTAYGWRSERQAALQLGEHLAVRVLPLQLVDPRFYHLDTALCPLTSGHVMVHMDAFSAHSQRLLRQAVDREHLIEVNVHDAAHFACNALEIGDAVIMHAASRKLAEQLNAAGYRVFQTDLSQFIRAGGSAKKLTLRLDDGPAAKEAAA